MVHQNRGRLTVDPDGNWRFYTNSVPAGCTALGTVTRDGETGALVVTEAGIYSMLNERVYRALDQRKVKAALSPEGGRGRPALGERAMTQAERAAKAKRDLEGSGGRLLNKVALRREANDVLASEMVRTGETAGDVINRALAALGGS
jgi:hypothetical protein